MKNNWHLAGLYLLYDPATNMYYVGQTKDMKNRYDAQTRNKCVAFVEEPGKLTRLALEEEAVAFCEAFGLTLWNKQLITSNKNWRF